MPYSRSIDSDEILITTLWGGITSEDLYKLGKEMGHYIHGGNVYEMVLHSKDVKVAVNKFKLRDAAYQLTGQLSGPGRATIALVSDRDFVFGLCRQLELQAENEFIRISVFRNEVAARLWLLDKRLSDKLNVSSG